MGRSAGTTPPMAAPGAPRPVPIGAPTTAPTGVAPTLRGPRAVGGGPLGLGSYDVVSLQRRAGNRATVRATVQRELSSDDAAALHVWLAQWEKLLKLDRLVVANLIATSTTLDEAKRSAVACGIADAFKRLTTQGHARVVEQRKAEFPAGPRSSQSLKPAVRSLTAELARAYDLGQHVVVLLGNSPAVLVTELLETRVRWAFLPLGGLTDHGVMRAAFGEEPSIDPQQQRTAYAGLFARADERAGKLRTYIASFLSGLPSGRDLVLVDFAETGVSLLAVADMLRSSLAASDDRRTVKLFAFTPKLPSAGSLLDDQRDYDATYAAPVGEAEQAFVKLTREKVYKKLLLVLGRSLPINEVLEAGDPTFEPLLARVLLPRGAEQLTSGHS